MNMYMSVWQLSDCISQMVFQSMWSFHLRDVEENTPMREILRELLGLYVGEWFLIQVQYSKYAQTRI